LKAQTPHKVLYCIDTLVRGGTELQLVGLIDRLDRRLYTPCLLTLRPTPPELVPADCVHLDWQVSRLFSWRGLRALLSLVRWLRRERVGVVQTFFQDSTIFGLIAARLAGVPVRLACFRDLGFWRTGPQTVVLRQVYRLATGFLSNAAVVRDHFVGLDGLDPQKFTVVRNGVDTASLAWVDHAGPTTDIGLVGNLNRQVKRADLFIQAAGRVARDHPQVRWHLVGDGYLRCELEDMAAAAGLSEQVVFAGRVADVAGYLENLQVGVLCSDSEGLSNALLEYLFKGCAAVATSVGGNIEVLEDGVNGLLVPPDNVAELAAALRSLVEDVVLRRRLSLAGRQRVEASFDWGACVDAHESVYERELAIYDLGRRSSAGS